MTNRKTPMVNQDGIVEMVETKLRPMYVRLWLTAQLAWKIWTPRWSRLYDAEDPWDCIPLWLAFSVAWGIHHDDGERIK